MLDDYSMNLYKSYYGINSAILKTGGRRRMEMDMNTIMLMQQLQGGKGGDISSMLPLLMSQGGDIDPTMLMMMGGGNIDPTQMLLMQQMQGGGGDIDPMMLMLMNQNNDGKKGKGKGGDDASNPMLMYLMMQQMKKDPIDVSTREEADEAYQDVTTPVKSGKPAPVNTGKDPIESALY